MKVHGQPLRPLRALPSGDAVEVIDQRQLPHRLVMARLGTPKDVFTAIRDMWVRGAPLIGASAAYGLALQMRTDAGDAALQAAVQHLKSARPTAVNLAWALDRMQARLAPLPVAERAAAAWQLAGELAEEDVQVNRAIGEHGLALIRDLAQRRPGPVRVLTHCNEIGRAHV